MIQPGQVFLLVAPVDMRWGIDRLSLLVQQTDGRSPCDGTAYGFTNRNHSRLKLLMGWHRRLAVPSQPAQGKFPLARSR